MCSVWILDVMCSNILAVLLFQIRPWRAFHQFPLYSIVKYAELNGLIRMYHAFSITNSTCQWFNCLTRQPIFISLHITHFLFMIIWQMYLVVGYANSLIPRCEDKIMYLCFAYSLCMCMSVINSVCMFIFICGIHYVCCKINIYVWPVCDINRFTEYNNKAINY